MTLIKREKKPTNRLKGLLFSKRENPEKTPVQRRQKMAKLPLKDLPFTSFSLCALLFTSLNQANPDRLLT
jgi:hypothetical protein